MWEHELYCDGALEWRAAQASPWHGLLSNELLSLKLQVYYTIRIQTIIVTQITHGLKDQRPYYRSGHGV